MLRYLLLILAAALSSMLAQPAQAQIDTEGAAADYEVKCRSGDAESCWVIGRWYKGGIRLPQDVPKAVALLKRACQLGDDRGCEELADLQLSPGQGYDPQAAIAFYDSRCRAGDEADCLRLAEHFVGDEPGTTAEPEKARKYAERACTADSVEGCRIFTAMAAQGVGGAVDLAAAQRGSATGCELKQSVACLTVAKLVMDGGEDPRRALQFAQKACALRNAEGCTMSVGLAMEKLSPPDGNTAVKAAESGCALPDATSCLFLAKLYHDGAAGPADRIKARDAAEKACKLKSKDGCAAYVQMAETKAQVAAALSALCGLKEFSACMEFGRMAEEGDGIAKDNLRAMFAYKAALKIDPNHAEAKRRLEEVRRKPIG